MIKYNFNKLKGKIKEVYNTQNDFAVDMEIAPNTLSSKLNGQSYFSSEEISRAVELLKIDNPTEVWNIFFNNNIEKNSTEQCDTVRKV